MAIDIETIKPGGWGLEELLQSEEMNRLLAELAKAIDGVNGGTYELADDLIFEGTGSVLIRTLLEIADGAQLNVLGALFIRAAALVDEDATLSVEGIIRILTGAELQVANGGILRIESGGDIVVDSGGDINLQLGAQLHVNGTVDVHSTGAINIESGAELVVRSGGDLVVESVGDIVVEAGGEILLSGDLDVLNGGQIDLQSGATLNALSGAAINVELGGAVNVETGGAINVVGGAITVQSGSSLLVGAGASAAIQTGAVLSVAAANDLVINGSAENFRLSMTPFFVQATTGGDPRWKPVGAKWRQTESAAVGLYEIWFALPLPPGDTVSGVNVMLNGGPILPASLKPRLSIVRVDIDGVINSLAETVDTSGSDAAYNASHIVSLAPGTETGGSTTMPILLTSDPHYVVLRGEQGGTDDTLELRSIFGAAIARSYRGTGTTMVY